MTDHPSTPLTRRAIAGLAAGILLLAACSAGGAAGPSAAGAGNGSAAGAGGPTSAANVGGGGGAAGCGNPAAATVGAVGGAYASMLAGVLCGMPNIDPCSYLKPADVQALFKTPLGQPTTDHLGNCTWPLADPSQGDGLDIVVNVGQGEGPLNNDMGTGGSTTPISGIGDHASWGLLGGYFPHLGAVKGQATCEVDISGGDGQLGVPTSGQGVFAKIDAAALPGFMQRFGALCNDIFAGLGA